MRPREFLVDPGRQAGLQAGEMNDETFLRVLDRTCRAMDESGIGYGLLGGVASSALGRPRWTRDIDIFVRPEDAGPTLDALDRHGYLTQKTNANWIFKAWLAGVLVDVLFRAKRDVYFDDEMEERCRVASFKGVQIRTICPEDLIVIKSVVHDEDTPRHWFDALGVLACQALDWDYLIRRAFVAGPKRVLSLLVYAQSSDVAVPDDVVHRLSEAVYAR